MDRLKRTWARLPAPVRVTLSIAFWLPVWFIVFGVIQVLVEEVTPSGGTGAILQLLIYAILLALAWRFLIRPSVDRAHGGSENRKSLQSAIRTGVISPERRSRAVERRSRALQQGPKASLDNRCVGRRSARRRSPCSRARSADPEKRSDGRRFTSPPRPDLLPAYGSVHSTSRSSVCCTQGSSQLRGVPAFGAGQLIHQHAGPEARGSPGRRRAAPMPTGTAGGGPTSATAAVSDPTATATSSAPPRTEGNHAALAAASLNAVTQCHAFPSGRVT